MAQATGLYAIIAYTRAGEGYGLWLSLGLHIRPWVYVTEHGSVHYHRNAERRRLEQCGFEKCRCGTVEIVKQDDGRST